MACHNILLGGLAAKESKDPTSIFSIYGFLAELFRFFGLFSFAFVKNLEPKYYLIPLFSITIATLILESILLRKYDQKDIKNE